MTANPADGVRSRGMAPGGLPRTRCPLCDGADLRFTLSLRDRSLLTCSGCGVRVTDTYADGDAVADYYTAVEAHHGKLGATLADDGALLSDALLLDPTPSEASAASVGRPAERGAWSFVPATASVPHATGPRVGVSGPGGDAIAHPWRYWMPGEPSVSAYRPATPRRRA